MALLLRGSLLILLMLQLCVHGNYVVVVRIYDYTNPSNTGQFRGSDNCCDNSRQNGVCSTNRRCDNRFTFCLKMLNDSDDGTSACMGDVLMTTEINMNDAPIDFSGSTWLGLDNPLRLNGVTTAWQGAQVYVEVHDWDTNRNDDIFYQLVDQWRLNVEHIVFTAGADLSPPDDYPGIYGFGNLNLSFRVECAENYYGTFCENLDECLSDSIDCNQGNCVDGDGLGTCVCDPGYTGQFCGDIDECAGVSCSGNGVCVDGVNSFSCECVSGYTGPFCETEINECEVSNVNCNENGQCVDELNSYSCECEPGYTGVDCEVDIDECLGQNCNGNGVCMDGINNFICNCTLGYTGQFCETEINECEVLNMNCNENGQCVDELNSYSCDCVSGYTGSLCETNIDDCVNGNCSGNGVCVDGVNSFSCECVSGYTGDMCSVETQEVRSDGATATIAGGVVGGLVGLVLIAVIAVLIVIIVKNKQEYDVNRGTANNDIICQDNAVYGVCEMNTARPQATTLATDLPPSSLQEHKFDNSPYEVSEPLPPVYERVVVKDDRLVINVNVSYATIDLQ